MPAFDAAAFSTTGAINASSLTFSQTCTGSGLTLFVGVISSTVPTRVDYGGFAMSRWGNDVTLSVTNSIWYLAAPPTGANNVVITMPSSSMILGGAISLTGAAQEGSKFTHVSRTTGAATSLSTTISPMIPDCMLIDFFGEFANSAPTAGGSQTSVVSQSSASTGGQGMSYRTVSGKPDTTNSWSWVGNVSAVHRILAVPGPTVSNDFTPPTRPHPFQPGLAR